MARVLLIEDNPANLELMVYLLQAFGHTPLTAQSGQAGLAAARSQAPDLILCDIQLPDFDGYEIARRIKADPELRGLPLVAVTALAMAGDSDKALAAGFDGYITKPITPETFVAEAEAFLGAERGYSRLPVADHAVGTTQLTPPGTRALILVVDDSPLNVELLRGILEPSGYMVRSANMVPLALELARQHVPDLIISDLNMQPLSGYDLLRQIKGEPQLSQIPVIIHSASAADRKYELEALALGAARFVPRPVEPEDLLRAIEACLQPGPGG